MLRLYQMASMVFVDNGAGRGQDASIFLRMDRQSQRLREDFKEMKEKLASGGAITSALAYAFC